MEYFPRNANTDNCGLFGGGENGVAVGGAQLQKATTQESRLAYVHGRTFPFRLLKIATHVCRGIAQIGRRSIQLVRLDEVKREVAPFSPPESNEAAFGMSFC